MATFEVTPEDLTGLAAQLSGLVGELSAATGSIAAGAAGAAQNGKLERAIDSFVGDWATGVEDLRTQLGEVSRRLGASGGAYEQTESGIGGQFEG